MPFFRVDPTILATVSQLPPPVETNLVQEDDNLLLTESGDSLLCE
jgi:hypothetical protein